MKATSRDTSANAGVLTYSDLSCSPCTLKVAEVVPESTTLSLLQVLQKCSL